MFTPLEIFVAWRYTRAPRRTQFISLISAISIGGVALGIIALLTILSIMNGFEAEMRERLLGMSAHLEVKASHGPLQSWEQVAREIAARSDVVGVAPFVDRQAMLTSYGEVQGATVLGIDPNRENLVSVLGARMRQGSLAALQPGRFGVVVGRGLADSLRLNVGDDVSLILAEPLRTATGMLPRLKRCFVVGIFEAGVQEYDTATIYLNLRDAQRLFRLTEGIDGLHVKLTDAFRAEAIGRELFPSAAPYVVADWTTQHANLFRALQTEKIVMFVILLLSVAVAAFNLVSTLVMGVAEKSAQIAILQTLGMTPRRVLRIFMTQGALIGATGVTLGTLGGVLLARHIEAVIAWLEATFHFKILAPDVYYISHIPAQLNLSDVALTFIYSLALCLLAPLYPAWLASQTRPAEALRYE